MDDSPGLFGNLSGSRVAARSLLVVRSSLPASLGNSVAIPNDPHDSVKGKRLKADRAMLGRTRVKRCLEKVKKVPYLVPCEVDWPVCYNSTSSEPPGSRAVPSRSRRASLNPNRGVRRLGGVEGRG